MNHQANARAELDLMTMGVVTQPATGPPPAWWPEWAPMPHVLQHILDDMKTIEAGAKLPKSGWPAAVPVRPDHWDIETRSYRLALGDTLSGLAATYLGSPQRWSEIWNEQTDVFRANNNPDELMAGTWIRMPIDAFATLCRATGKCQAPPGSKPAPPPPGGYKPTTPPAAKTKASGTDDLLLWGGAAAALVAAVVIFGKKKRG